MGSALLEQVINGLMMGSIYVLVGLGLVLIYGVMHVLNFAHGMVFMLGGYLCYTAFAAITGSYVASILLAFGVDAWWDERQDREAEQEILSGLHEEFTRVAQGLEDSGAIWDSISVRIGTPLAAAEAGRDLSLAQARASLAAMTAPYTFDPGSGVRDALIASGRLDLIRHGELRRQLVAWDGVLREVQDNEVFGRAFILDT